MARGECPTLSKPTWWSSNPIYMSYTDVEVHHREVTSQGCAKSPPLYHELDPDDEVTEPDAQSTTAAARPLRPQPYVPTTGLYCVTDEDLVPVASDATQDGTLKSSSSETYL